MVFSTNAEKAFDDMQLSFTIYLISRIRYERKVLKIIKAVYYKPVSNITPNGGKVERSRTT